MPSYDAIVIGAGAIGAATAYHLARSGRSVCVVDARGVASGATGAAEGIVGSVAKRKAGPVTEIVTRSFEALSSLKEELEHPVEFVRKPGVMVVHDESDEELLRAFVSKRQREGIDIAWLDRAETRALEPGLGDAIRGAVYTPTQGIVNPIQLTHAFLNAARRLGAQLRIPAQVVSMERRGDRLQSLETTMGRLSSEFVVNAAGSAASAVAALAGSNIAITPKRAQMLVSEALPPGALRNTIYSGAVVAAGLNRKTLDFEDVPSEDRQRSAELMSDWQLSSFTQTARGNVLFCGGFGFDDGGAEVDPRVLPAIARNIADLIPGYRGLRIIRAWAALEPCTPNNLPVIGNSLEVRNLFHAAGHGNAGVMMSPHTGELIADLVDGSNPSAILLALERASNADAPVSMA
jgi:glycine/D-amino acid oxidase-like deaminating enzyme